MPQGSVTDMESLKELVSEMRDPMSLLDMMNIPEYEKNNIIFYIKNKQNQQKKAKLMAAFEQLQLQHDREQYQHAAFKKMIHFKGK